MREKKWRSCWKMHRAKKETYKMRMPNSEPISINCARIYPPKWRKWENTPLFAASWSKTTRQWSTIMNDWQQNSTRPDRIWRVWRKRRRGFLSMWNSWSRGSRSTRTSWETGMKSTKMKKNWDMRTLISAKSMRSWPRKREASKMSSSTENSRSLTLKER